ncbi:hypothetical protein PMAYCL1PPCAC_07958 [Pristionchus mayeri]|uniref:Uncharacterized protein n=1 Tax=Pristionchus mayeri TaxID=1317129 RepID=A0AAN4ZAV2_9BILA|nr:hypothetical protein PMAYCL1PPCAC_07958 [Pristionchus mayeri]
MLSCVKRRALTRALSSSIPYRKASTIRMTHEMDLAASVSEQRKEMHSALRWSIMNRSAITRRDSTFFSSIGFLDGRITRSMSMKASRIDRSLVLGSRRRTYDGRWESASRGTSYSRILPFLRRRGCNCPPAHPATSTRKQEPSSPSPLSSSLRDAP